jgi:hypothetical protein
MIWSASLPMSEEPVTEPGLAETPKRLAVTRSCPELYCCLLWIRCNCARRRNRANLERRRVRERRRNFIGQRRELFDNHALTQPAAIACVLSE